MVDTIVYCTNSRCMFNQNGCSTYYGVCSNKAEIAANMFKGRVYNESCKYQEEAETEDCGIISVIVPPSIG